MNMLMTAYLLESFILDFAPGEWQPFTLVKLPMATRELRQAPIIVLTKNPITISVEISTRLKMAFIN